MLNDKIKNTVAQSGSERNLSGTHGIIQSYDPQSNTATVLLSAADSDVAQDIITNVMCPVIMGVQTVAPEPGRPCWVVFKGGQNDRKAMISHYFNHKFQNFDYGPMYNSRSGIQSYQLRY